MSGDACEITVGQFFERIQDCDVSDMLVIIHKGVAYAVTNIITEHNRIVMTDDTLACLGAIVGLESNLLEDRYGSNI